MFTTYILSFTYFIHYHVVYYVVGLLSSFLAMKKDISGQFWHEWTGRGGVASFKSPKIQLKSIVLGQATDRIKAGCKEDIITHWIWISSLKTTNSLEYLLFSVFIDHLTFSKCLLWLGIIRVSGCWFSIHNHKNE